MTSSEAPVEIVPYDPAWPVKFEEEAAILRRVLAPWLAGSIEHIGSTAVPGLAAKPVRSRSGITCAAIRRRRAITGRSNSASPQSTASIARLTLRPSVRSLTESQKWLFNQEGARPHEARVSG